MYTFSQLHTYTHIHTYICTWSNSPIISEERTHSFWMKIELQFLLHREGKGFHPLNAK